MKTNISAVPPNSIHQKAVNTLIEIALFTPELRAKIPDARTSVPRSKVPALFRAAIKEQRAIRRSRYRQETAILVTALALLEGAEDENRTPEQDEFYSALGWKCTGDHIRVTYDPQNVVVN